eukprot:TRINITY_DN1405_c0_g1_i1.p1 TRINITY_DN1405_c0_g1~~TRINITY_DN1405_c0_g1_i1.p1  ORF type:complete len:553 (-),score=146.66 TRINITY_DN1405_c0_g1_i1:42-1700(-)
MRSFVAVIVAVLLAVCCFNSAEAFKRNTVANLKIEDAAALSVCTECMLIADPILFLLEQNQTAPMIEQGIEKFCGLLPSFMQTNCFKIAKDVVIFLPKLLYWDKFEDYDAKAICTMFNLCDSPCCESKAPEQIHIAVTGDATQMVVTWISSENVDATVQFGLSSSSLTNSVQANTHTYKNGGWRGYIHDAILNDLQPFTTYYYRVGGNTYGWSNVFSFQTFTNDYNAYANLEQSFLLIGDMGADPESPDTIARLKTIATSHTANLLIHNGDISYADGIQHRMDLFMRSMQDVTANLPYMVTPGNHEVGITTLFNDSTFEHRFLMPLDENKATLFSKRALMPFRNTRFEKHYGVSTAVSGELYSNFFYSFDYGLFHFIGMDTESEFDIPLVTAKQRAWLINDLIKANQNRKQHPWIVVYGHRPLYCSNPGLDCTEFGEYLRLELEDIFNKYSVDMVFAGHKHSYERFYQVRNNKFISNNYNQPTVPIYITNGAGGNRENFQSFIENYPAFSAVRLREWGYNWCSASNSTVLQCNFFRSSDNALHDSITIVKNH